jgi:hypothetical protein
LAHASVEGPDPRTAQQKATAIAYLNSQQVNKILQDMVAELIVSQPPSALEHMHATLANLLGNEPAGAGGTGKGTGDHDPAMKGKNSEKSHYGTVCRGCARTLIFQSFRG